MAIKDVFKVSRKTFFNPSAWLDFESIKTNNRTIFSILKGLFTIDRPERKETFAEAMQRLGVNQAEVEKTGKDYQWYAYLFAFCALLAFVYSFVQLFYYHTISGWILSIAVTALFAAQAFRYDFWAFQIKQGKLGCTFEEWKNAKLKK